VSTAKGALALPGTDSIEKEVGSQFRKVVKKVSAIYTDDYPPRCNVTLCTRQGAHTHGLTRAVEKFVATRLRLPDNVKVDASIETGPPHFSAEPRAAASGGS
jgi:hypothetical protein